MQSIRDALEVVLELIDDSTQSHAVRMIKIKGKISQALTDLNDAPRETVVMRRPGRPKKDA